MEKKCEPKIFEILSPKAYARELVKTYFSNLFQSQRVKHHHMNKLVLQAMTSLNKSPAVEERLTNAVIYHIP